MPSMTAFALNWHILRLNDYIVTFYSTLEVPLSMVFAAVFEEVCLWLLLSMPWWQDDWNEQNSDPFKPAGNYQRAAGETLRCGFKETAVWNLMSASNTVPRVTNDPREKTYYALPCGDTAVFARGALFRNAFPPTCSQYTVSEACRMQASFFFFF